jgi:hypothetical protein
MTAIPTVDFDPPHMAMRNAVVIFINGPPYSGKDTAAEFLAPQFKRSNVMRFAGPLKHSVHIDFGLPKNLPDDYFDGCKDSPNPAFFGMSPREAYIQKSERRQKPFLGPSIYGQTAVRAMWRRFVSGKRIFFIPDSGFAAEAHPVLYHINNKNALLLRVHADKRGKTFANDSRSYIDLPGIDTYDISNDSTVDDYHSELSRVVLPVINRKTNHLFL